MRKPDSDSSADPPPAAKRLRRVGEALALSALLAYRRAVMPIWRAEAAHKQRKFCRHYVAVIGSCGKSTTTMLTGSLIGAQRSVEVGLFDNVERFILRTLRKLDHPVDFVVQEVSEFPAGTIAGVAARRRPDCVIVTSIGLDHLSSFRTNSAVAEEMSSLTRTSPIVCLNADDESVRALATTAGGRIVLFGRQSGAHVRAENVTSHLPERLRFDLVVGGMTRRVETRFIGTLMLTNVLGALAAVHAMGLDLDRAIETLAGTEPARGRLSVFDGPRGHTIVLDTIKAPLWSTRLLVADLENMCEGRRIFVLGTLSDTGSGGTGSRSRQVLLAAAKVCDLVIGIDGAQSPASRLMQRGTHQNIVAAKDLAAAARLLADQPPAMIVVKGNELRRQHSALMAELKILASLDAPQA